jgi:uncharacterized YccA/Bax inhibitor family protein
MHSPRTNRLSCIALIVLSLTALVTVLIGFTQPPLPDEGTLAHIFQLAVAAIAPTSLLFLATADWTEPLPTARRLALPAIALVLAFAALYRLEHP